jgi:predicted TIM-barrel fold metal-dependent hydrolase
MVKYMFSESTNRPIDTHVHLWSDDFSTYPLASGVRPSDLAVRRFRVEDILAHARANAVERVVLVQMSYYGFDNTLMLDAIAIHPEQFRGIAIIDANQENPTYQMCQLKQAGVRGFRLVAIEHPAELIYHIGLKKMFACAAAEDLAICFLTVPENLSDIEVLCEQFPLTPVIIDHMARIGMDGAIRPRDVDALCRLARYPRTMIKLSAFYALGHKRPPHDDLGGLIYRLYTEFGSSRLMWGSDSPFQLLGETYGDSISLVRDRLAFFSDLDKYQILQGSAERVFFR